MEYNEFLSLAKSRQSCREFNDKPLDKQVVESIIKTAFLAPSACNSQPWRVIAVTEEEGLKIVRNAVQERGMNKFADKAKAFLLLVEKEATLKESTLTRFHRNYFVKYDVGQLTAYITLTAQSLGVSSCILGWVNHQTLKDNFDIGENQSCNLVIALGYSDIPVREKTRKDADQLITFK